MAVSYVGNPADKLQGASPAARRDERPAPARKRTKVQREADEISGIAQNREAIMRTITVAAAMILLLTAHANSQNLNMLGGLGDKRPLSAEEVAKQKAADEAYKAAVGKIPDQKSTDPWGTVRDAAPSKNSQMKPQTGPK